MKFYVFNLRVQYQTEKIPILDSLYKILIDLMECDGVYSTAFDGAAISRRNKKKYHHTIIIINKTTLFQTYTVCITHTDINRDFPSEDIQQGPTN